MELFLWQHTYEIYKKGDITDIKKMGTVQQRMPHKCYHGKTGRVYNITQHAVGIVVNKQVKGKILAKRMNVCIEHIKYSKSRDSFLKRVKENDQKKKEVEVKGSSALSSLIHQCQNLKMTLGIQRHDIEFLLLQSPPSPQCKGKDRQPNMSFLPPEEEPISRSYEEQTLSSTFLEEIRGPFFLDQDSNTGEQTALQFFRPERKKPGTGAEVAEYTNPKGHCGWYIGHFHGDLSGEASIKISRQLIMTWCEENTTD
ncbi:60S ribosomal protein L21 [Tupaia chinensis]|uniref:60S ribosomal protein L21 n=1 Tax=Tupaia chinensis TaxID=246437 RepID=L9KK32_TUPCH|nr:60S ribosomal protein L21 [Tupaia chinensis]